MPDRFCPGYISSTEYCYEGVTTVYIEAHDKGHGWTPERLTVDLGKASDGYLRVERKRNR